MKYKNFNPPTLRIDNFIIIAIDGFEMIINYSHINKLYA